MNRAKSYFLNFCSHLDFQPISLWLIIILMRNRSLKISRFEFWILIHLAYEKTGCLFYWIRLAFDFMMDLSSDFWIHFCSVSRYFQFVDFIVLFIWILQISLCLSFLVFSLEFESVESFKMYWLNFPTNFDSSNPKSIHQRQAFRCWFLKCLS